MGGLYNVVASDGHEFERGSVLLAVLGNPDVGRFRDAWVEKSDDGPVVAIYTRNGGGNRECWCDKGDHATYGACTAIKGEALTHHPLYLRDADDEFDRTYATYYFRVPEQYREALAAVASEPINMSEHWLAVIAALDEQVKQAKESPDA